MNSIISIDPALAKPHAYVRMVDGEISHLGFLNRDFIGWQREFDFISDVDTIIFERPFVGKNRFNSMRMAEEVGIIKGVIMTTFHCTDELFYDVGVLEWIRWFVKSGKIPKREFYIGKIVKELNERCWELIRTLDTKQREDVGCALQIGLFYLYKKKEGLL